MTFKEDAEKEPAVKTGIPFVDGPLNKLDLNKDGVSDVKELELLAADLEHDAEELEPLVKVFVAEGGLTVIENLVTQHLTPAGKDAFGKMLALITSKLS